MQWTITYWKGQTCLASREVRMYSATAKNSKHFSKEQRDYVGKSSSSHQAETKQLSKASLPGYCLVKLLDRWNL